MKSILLLLLISYSAVIGCPTGVPCSTIPPHTTSIYTE